ncbi:lipid droplet-regulating VLDL assembly factor AUP1-like [Oscarella lobularis]|uniref:lipid droplet-regulating VLDL assembly factor AUP1-like n=1 Tax=Oscarella lobularis TaxID=121494 RepID=UPI003313F65F
MPSNSSDIALLFHRYRLLINWRLFFLFLYSPLGILLILLRLSLAFQLFLFSCFVPKQCPIKRRLFKLTYNVLGISVSAKGKENRDSKAKILVSNHVSVMDHCALESVLASYEVENLDSNSTFTWFWRCKKFGNNSIKVEDILDGIREYCNRPGFFPPPLLFFPEGHTTNGSYGLLSFSQEAFQVDQPVQPIVVRAERPFFSVAISLLDSWWLTDLLWALFVPITFYHFETLEIMYPVSGETPQDFAKRTQTAMAKALGICATDYTAKDKETLQKGGGENRTSSDSFDSELVHQVKEVLPHVPTEAIQRDLARTHSVDLTISNFLEGTIEFIPERNYSKLPPPEEEKNHTPHSSKRKKLPSPSLSPSNSGGGVSFSKSAQDRHLSFQERKKAFLEDARRKYIEKRSIQLETPA